MTPPDSGDKPLCIVCWLPATRGLPEDGGKLYWCDKHGPFYDKPNSGEREVSMTRATPEQNAKAEAILAELGGGVAVLPLSLAQRILAALERLGASDEDLALAAELRDRVLR